MGMASVIELQANCDRSYVRSISAVEVSFCLFSCTIVPGRWHEGMDTRGVSARSTHPCLAPAVG